MQKITSLIRRIFNLNLSHALVPLALAWLSAGGYILMVRYLGFYWDDWIFAWVSQVLGSESLAQYFSTNRPFWGLIFQVTTPLLGETPWHWQVFGLFWRWASALALWWSLRQVWRRQPMAAVWISFFFAVYPGFSQQPIAITYGHFFIVLTAYFLSLGLMIRGYRQARDRRWAAAAGTLLPGLLLSLVNLVTMEYFFMLDLLRPLFLWIAIVEDNPNPNKPQKSRMIHRLRQTMIGWLPFLLLFAAVMIWRMFFFKFQTQNYAPVALKALQTAPLQTILDLAGTALHDLWVTLFAAWGNAFLLPDPVLLGARSTLLYAAIVLFSLLLCLVFLLRLKPALEEKSGWGWQVLITGGAAVTLAVVPFWLTGLPVGLAFPNDRFTLPFTVGVSMILAGLLRVLPIKPWQKGILLSLAISLAVGQHFQVATAYRRDWNTQRSLFWQMSWRIPGIQPGTTILANDWKNRYYSDNSLTSPLNWIYAPANHSQQMSYMFYYPEVRLGLGLKAFEKGLPIEQNYLAATFSASTSQVIVIQYSPEACLRVLDPQLEADNWMISPLMRQAAALSSTDPILPLPEAEAAVPPAAIFGAEPAHGWCYYFEKADLARQQENWAEVAGLGDTAFSLGDSPNDPMERLVFIEGYAHTGGWERAQELTEVSLEITPVMQPILCRLWQRMDAEIPASTEKQQAVQEAEDYLDCE